MLQIQDTTFCIWCGGLFVLLGINQNFSFKAPEHFLACLEPSSAV